MKTYFYQYQGAKPPRREQSKGRTGKKDEADHFCNGKCRKNEGNPGNPEWNRMERAVVKGRGHRCGNRRKTAQPLKKTQRSRRRASETGVWKTGFRAVAGFRRKKLLCWRMIPTEIDWLRRAGHLFSRYMGHETSYREKTPTSSAVWTGVPARLSAPLPALPDGNSLVTRGTIEGYIGWEECGSNGFGYDPIFYLYENDKSTAELSAEEKRSSSGERRCASDEKDVGRAGIGRCRMEKTDEDTDRQ